MTELAKPTMLLKHWRERNGYTTPEWESYVTAVTIQDITYLSVSVTIAAIAGYLVGRGFI